MSYVKIPIASGIHLRVEKSEFQAQNCSIPEFVEQVKKKYIGFYAKYNCWDQDLRYIFYLNTTKSQYLVVVEGLQLEYNEIIDAYMQESGRYSLTYWPKEGRADTFEKALTFLIKLRTIAQQPDFHQFGFFESL